MLGNRSPWLGQVRLVQRPWLGQPIDTSNPAPPPQLVIQCKPGADCPSAFCLTIGPVSKPDLDKVRAQLQAKPSGTFWIYPKTAIGPGDQDYVVWCSAYSTPVQGAVFWTPPAGLVSAPEGSPASSTPPPSVPASGTASMPAAPSSGTVLAVGGGLAAAGLLAFLAFR